MTSSYMDGQTQPVAYTRLAQQPQEEAMMAAAAFGAATAAAGNAAYYSPYDMYPTHTTASTTGSSSIAATAAPPLPTASATSIPATTAPVYYKDPIPAEFQVSSSSSDPNNIYAAAAAAAAAAGLSTPSLPPLSHLLPTSCPTSSTSTSSNPITIHALTAAARGASTMAPMGPTTTAAAAAASMYDKSHSNSSNMIYPDAPVDHPSASARRQSSATSTYYPVQPHQHQHQQHQQHQQQPQPPQQQHYYYDHRPPHYLPSYTAAAPTTVRSTTLPSPPHSITHEQLSSQPKVFSFVALPGINERKRPRRKFHEIERLYQCNFRGCSKAYGTLNHLNAHVCMQGHGPKRHPSEFKELRKQWRKQKRETGKSPVS